MNISETSGILDMKVLVGVIRQLRLTLEFLFSE